MSGSDSDFSSNSMSDSDSNSSSVFVNLVIFVTIHDSVKKLFISQCHKKNQNTFDVLTFIQMRTVSKITTIVKQPFKKQSSII